jgi:sulfur-oxidizing protein SoxZ
MGEDIKPRVRHPARAAPGERVTLRVQATHPMETGLRLGPDGAVLDRSIINRFSCDFNGVNVIDIVLEPGISANPYFEFEAKVEVSGSFRFAWHDDDGTVHEMHSPIRVG